MPTKKLPIGRLVATAALLLFGVLGARVYQPVWFDSIERISSLPPDVVYDSPAPIFLDETTLVVAFREVETGRILIATSADTGGTWTAPGPIFDNGPTGRDDIGLQILELESGRLILSIRSEATVNSLLISDDRAANWMGGVSRNADGAEKFVVVDGQLWHIYSDHASGDILREVSTDGQTWSEPSMLVENDLPATNRLSPIDVAELAGGDHLLLVIRKVVEPCCDGSLELYRSTDGIDWIGPEPVYSYGNDEVLTPSQLEAAEDSVFILATAPLKSLDGFEGAAPRDIFYLSAPGDATTWSGPTRFTRYPGDDYDPVGTSVSTSLVVFFASERFSAPGSPQIWYGRPGETPDLDPPPAIINSTDARTPSWSKPGVEVGVLFEASDAEAAASAEVVSERDGETAMWPLFDDGEHGDGAAGDGLWGGGMGPFDFGPDISYFPRVYDESGQIGEGNSTGLEILPFHDVGRFQLVLSAEASFGDFFIPQLPPAGAGQWPGGQGQNYVAGGGLWIGARVDSVDRVMHAFYEVTSAEGDWQQIEGLFPESGHEISDQDLIVTYSDSAAPQPLGLRVTQTSRQWADDGIDNFIVFEYEVTNISDDSLRDAMAAFWLDPDLVLENNTFAFDDLVDWDPGRHMVYIHDSGIACNDPVLNPDNVLCPPGYLGLRLLSNPRPGHTGALPLTATAWNPTADPSRTINDSDEPFLELMMRGVSIAQFDSTSVVPGDYRFLVTARAFSLAPGESVSVAFGMAIGASLDDLQGQADAMVDLWQGTPLTAEDRSRDLPESVSVVSTYPNPFSAKTAMEFEVSEPGPVKVSVYNVLGERLSVLADGDFAAGSHRVRWDSGQIPSGVYFYVIESGDWRRSGQIVKVR